MTQGTHGQGADSPAPGLQRRTALAGAWTIPVIAAAVSAPGAAASAPPSAEGPFVGVVLTRSAEAIDEFVVEVRVARTGPAGSPVVLPLEARIDITTDHDVDVWSGGIVADGPRAGRLVIPPGSYRNVGSIALEDTATLQLGSAASGLSSTFSPLPKGLVTVTATVTRGPVYTGTDGRGYGAIGLASRTIRFSL
ncbi:hypothetical protein GTU73_10595 [Rathayibacter sp. VKM Ac-2804]|uniref:hypothetical protein n=1 Tax=Rathayibacter sp. VKM Ac-2804 TaxID=2609257 RepID=UPI00132EC11F|nr:hypothetical protein [Rathayibacter sp. VKM Ac-2804]QHF24410.1 hypothetical protein GTU73_10595 [Rathayibacter sp. VKM Ac-2804]